MLNPKDRALHAGLIKILDDATFPLKAREVQAFAQVYAWAKALDHYLDSKPEPAPKAPKKSKGKIG